MRIGLLAYASPTGVGTQTLNLYKHLEPTKTLLVDFSPINHFPHYEELYAPQADATVVVVKGIPQAYDINSFCRDIDILIMVDTPLNYYFINCCRERGIKTVLYYRYEQLDYLTNPTLPKPDLLLASSPWQYDEVAHYAYNMSIPLACCPTPVDREVLPFTKRTEVRHFLHIAGHGDEYNRNGTDILHAAMKLVKNPSVQLTIRAQYQVTRSPSDKRITIITESISDYTRLYNNEDCLLMPRRFGGSCQPLNEAMSTGMLALMPNRAPQNQLLPSQLLLPSTLKAIVGRHIPVAAYYTEPAVLAAYIDHLAAMPSEDVMLLSEQMNALAEKISWSTQKQTIMEILKDVCATKPRSKNRVPLHIQSHNGQLRL